MRDTLSTFELGCWAAIARFGKFGPKRWGALIASFPTMDDVWRASATALVSDDIDDSLAREFAAFRDRVNPEQEYEDVQQDGIELVRISDTHYPRRLKEIYDPPPLLFIRGKLNDPEEPMLAVVGTRKATPYARLVMSEIVEPLARAGITIVSGLALGVDGLAHRAALDVQGRTIGVPGAGVEDANIYPETHRGLSREIIESGGVLLSEFPPGSRAFKSNFPQRNRVISGLSLGVLVVEAHPQSGSLLTAKSALDQNRDVFAVPGDIGRETSVGPNSLIKSGARPVTSAQDVLDALGLERPAAEKQARTILADTKEEAAILPLLSRQPTHIDELVRSSGLPASAVASTLTMMELKGKVRHLGGLQYVLAR